MSESVSEKRLWLDLRGLGPVKTSEVWKGVKRKEVSYVAIMENCVSRSEA